MEAGLRRLEQQEQKYSTELDAALKEYAELQVQATNLDPGELTDARLAIRLDKEHDAQQHIQSAYNNKYDSLMMLDSKQDVAKLLHEDSEVQSVRERLQKPLQEKKCQPQKKRLKDVAGTVRN